jgi:hypothetical protein
MLRDTKRGAGVLGRWSSRIGFDLMTPRRTRNLANCDIAARALSFVPGDPGCSETHLSSSAGVKHDRANGFSADISVGVHRRHQAHAWHPAVEEIPRRVYVPPPFISPR